MRSDSREAPDRPPVLMLDDAFVVRWVDRLRREIPDAIAIFVGGSQLRGDAGPFSDVDFDIVVPVGPRDEWPAWYEDAGERLVQISTWIRDVDTWLAAAEESQDWAFGLVCADPLRLCWAADKSWRERLDRTETVYPPGPPELGHFEASAGKVANAWLREDELALRLVAHDLAIAVVSLLVPLNPRPPVRSREEALRTLLDFDVAPSGYHHDMLMCLGLESGAAAAAVNAAARRVARGVLELLHAYASSFVGLIADSEATSIRDGSLRRYVEQAIGR